MTQLSYQPALDPFHAVFRMTRILPFIKSDRPLPRDQVRIVDFYLTFPFRVSGMRLMSKHQKFRRMSAKYEAERPYGEQPDDVIMFSRMKPMQVAALETLAAKNFIDAESLSAGLVRPTTRPLPAALAARATEANENEADLSEFIAALSFDYELLGQNGLKSRTGLMEHRYDAV